MRAILTRLCTSRQIIGEVVATAMRIGNRFLVYGPEQTIISCETEVQADRIANRFNR